ncbi:MAG: sel1 repeat family protein [Lentisphaeria bacterium]|nr:sel1 repeat family protein [Lentisphaeria bacterium]
MSNMKTNRNIFFAAVAVVALFLTGTAACGAGLPNKTDKQAEETKTEATEKTDRKKAEELYLQGMEYDSNDESEKAVECFRQAAELGHDKAQVLYAYTCMTEDRIDEGIKWYRAAAAQGNTMAPTLLGRIYFEEEQKMNMKEAARWFRKGAEQGKTFAQRMYGICCFEGYGVTQDRAEAVKWFRKAAEQTIPDSEALYMLGVCYRDGLGVDQDRAEAVKWFRKGAGHTDDYNAYGLGVCYMEGYGVEQDMKEAVKWFLKAAEQDLPYAQCALGICYVHGLGVAEDPAKAADYFKNAMDGSAKYSSKGLPERAENGDHEAQYWLGVCYEEGRGVRQDDTMAVAWLQAAEQENDRAQVALARLALKAGDLDAAERWLRKAAKRDNPSAKKLLAELFPGKEAAEKDDASAQPRTAEIGATVKRLVSALRPVDQKPLDTESVEWLRKAAEQGDPKAQCAYGICCLKHYGGAAGKAEAAEWFGKAIDGLRRAAEKGDPEAQTLLSECYGDGNGVRQDRTLSRIWLRKAAEQDFASAQLELAILLFVEDKDMKEADKWFRKAAENGESAAEGFMKRHFSDPEGE